jgi:uncharacterized membrane protein YqjE
MNDFPGTHATPPPTSSPLAVELPSPPANWRTALADLVGARVALIQLEAKQAAKSGVKRVIFFAAAAILLLLAWIIIVAGVVGAISDKNDFPWYWVALVAGGIHLLLAVILVVIAKRPGEAAFQTLSAEFKKDREWLQHFQTPKKSDN